MAIERLHETLALPSLENVIRYTQYDTIRINVSKVAFDAGLRQLAGVGIHPGTPIARVDVEPLFQANPVDCSQKRYDVVLTNAQYDKLINYLVREDYYYKTQGNHDDAEFVLAFSFGEKPTVNSQIRFEIEQKFGTVPNPPKIYAQWEIADMVPFLHAHLPFNRIGLDPGRDYIKTGEVIQKFRQMTNCGPGTKVFLACQAWHAPRCWRLCEDPCVGNLKVVGGLFVDLFSSNDPQPWVRDELSWVIKES